MHTARPPKLPLAAALFGLLAAAAACNLEQDVAIDLPPYTEQPVIEAYLTPGQPFTLLITRSAGFFDEFPLDDGVFFENTLLDSAEVSVRYADQVVELANVRGFDPTTGQGFNYATFTRVPENYADSLFLDVRFPDGTTATGATLLLPVVPIDSNVVKYNPQLPPAADTLAQILTYLTDPDTLATNRFRKILKYAALDSTVEQDVVFQDNLADQATIVTTTINEFSAGDTLLVYNAHVDRDFELYLTSVQTAAASNGNPFVQPSTILSNVTGSANPLGIFTSYAYDVDTVIIPAR